MRCLGTLFLLPIITILAIFGLGTNRRNIRQTRNLNNQTNGDHNRNRNDNDFKNAETVDYFEISDDGEATEDINDYDPNPTNNKRIEDAKWEEIE